MVTPTEKTFQELKKLKVYSPSDYIEKFSNILAKIQIEWHSPVTGSIQLNSAIYCAIEKLHESIINNGGRLIIIGNGGSAAIAMHASADYANAGGLRTMDLMNPALITCMANDYGYKNVFAKNIERFAEKDDILFAISSSGQSSNILEACKVASSKGCFVVTFSGFDSENSLRKLGDMNFYIPSNHYGFVELAHQALLHCILDLFVVGKGGGKCLEK